VLTWKMIFTGGDFPTYSALSVPKDKWRGRTVLSRIVNFFLRSIGNMHCIAHA
jgi:hypothetical protein